MTTPLKAIRAFCRLQCHPEPKTDYLRCEIKDCPLWRFRVGNPNLFLTNGRVLAFYEAKTTTTSKIRAEILKADAEAKQTKKTHMSYTQWWPFGELEYRPKEQARKAIARHCLNCMGNDYQLRRNCTSQNCPLHQFKTGKKESE